MIEELALTKYKFNPFLLITNIKTLKETPTMSPEISDDIHIHFLEMLNSHLLATYTYLIAKSQ